MISTLQMYVLIVAYLVIAATAAWERNFPRALYFVGATIISVAVLWMTIQQRTGAAG